MAIRLRGDKSVVKSLQGYRRGKAVGMQQAIRNATAFIYRESQKIVPVDTTALRQSGHTEFYGSGFNTRGDVVYDTEYAIYVHEDLTKWHDPPTSAKFIERPINEKQPEIKEIIRKALEKHR